MDIIIIFGVAVAIIGFIMLGISIWAITSRREIKYRAVLQEHVDQFQRVQAKIKEHRGE